MESRQIVFPYNSLSTNRYQNNSLYEGKIMQKNASHKLNEAVTAFDMDEPMYHLKCAIDCVDAVHTAMTDSPISPESLLDAMFGAITNLYNAYQELEGQIYLDEEDE